MIDVVYGGEYLKYARTRRRILSKETKSFEYYLGLAISAAKRLAVQTCATSMKRVPRKRVKMKNNKKGGQREEREAEAVADPMQQVEEGEYTSLVTDLALEYLKNMKKILFTASDLR